MMRLLEPLIPIVVCLAFFISFYRLFVLRQRLRRDVSSTEQRGVPAVSVLVRRAFFRKGSLFWRPYARESRLVVTPQYVHLSAKFALYETVVDTPRSQLQVGAIPQYKHEPLLIIEGTFKGRPVELAVLPYGPMGPLWDVLVAAGVQPAGPRPT